MERLTYRSPEFNSPVSYGACQGIKCSIDCDYCKINDLICKLCEYEDTGLEPEAVRRLQQDWTSLIMTLDELGGMPHLRELVQAEKDGRLVVLPSKTVWELTWDAGPDCDLVCPVSVDGNELCDFCDKGELFVYERPCTQELLKELGKTVFLTREEAEAALEGGDEG